ncbi:unnamed protein product, partial [Polarella glacialis]
DLRAGLGGPTPSRELLPGPCRLCLPGPASYRRLCRGLAHCHHFCPTSSLALLARLGRRTTLGKLSFSLCQEGCQGCQDARRDPRDGCTCSWHLASCSSRCSCEACS